MSSGYEQSVSGVPGSHHVQGALASPVCAQKDVASAPVGATQRRLLLWVFFVAFCAIGLARLQFSVATLPLAGSVTYFQALLLVAAFLGVGTLLRVVGDSERSVARVMCRIVLVYLVYELLVVIPVADSLSRANLNWILGSMDVRATWLLFPVMLTVCADDRARWLAGSAVVVAAALLVAWGAYAGMAGYGGYYVEWGEVRYRVLQGSASLMVAWPFVLALSGAVARRYVVPFLLLGVAGLLMSNHRSDLIAFAVAGTICLLMSGEIRRVLPALLPVALLGTIAILIWGQQAQKMFGYTLTHMFDTGSGNGLDRMMRWSAAWELFKSKPFNDGLWSLHFLVWRRDFQPHNFVLETAVTEGLAGLAFYGSMLWIAFQKAWRWGRRDAEVRAILGWLVVYVLFSLMNANHYLTFNMPLLVGALAALASRVDWLRRTVEQEPRDHVAAEVRA